ncbi:hypothetical protein BDR26DRAFT_871077 [Obelidium mucronatum]|nr:hypothetical protein BDR26DRAFT_871077 [Obelidium mucronatum]
MHYQEHELAGPSFQSQQPSHNIQATQVPHSTIPTTNPTAALQYQQTSFGFVKDKEDAILITEACVSGALKPVSDLTMSTSLLAMQSGTILVFVENSEQMQKMRFRDAGAWSSSRISGPFLLYRQVETSDKKKNDVILAGERSSLFTTTSLRPYTNDGNRYRVINYFYPNDVEVFYKRSSAAGPSNRMAGQVLPIPSLQPEFDQYKHLIPAGLGSSSSRGGSRKSSRQSSPSGAVMGMGADMSESPTVSSLDSSGSASRRVSWKLSNSSTGYMAIQDLVQVEPHPQQAPQPVHNNPYSTSDYQAPRSHSYPPPFWIPSTSQAHTQNAQSQFVLHSALMANRYDVLGRTFGATNTEFPHWLNEPAILPPLRNLNDHLRRNEDCDDDSER